MSSVLGSTYSTLLLSSKKVTTLLLLTLALIREIDKNLKYKSIKAFNSKHNYLIRFLL